MEVYVLDARKLGERMQAHEHLQEVFAFPDYYGKNLDALYDCLTELDNPQILITHSEEAGPYFMNLYPVLLEAGAVNIIH